MCDEPPSCRCRRAVSYCAGCGAAATMAASGAGSGGTGIPGGSVSQSNMTLGAVAKKTAKVAGLSGPGRPVSRPSRGTLGCRRRRHPLRPLHGAKPGVFKRRRDESVTPSALNRASGGAGTAPKKPRELAPSGGQIQPRSALPKSSKSSAGEAASAGMPRNDASGAERNGDGAARDPNLWSARALLELAAARASAYDARRKRTGESSGAGGVDDARPAGGRPTGGRRQARRKASSHFSSTRGTTDMVMMRRYRGEPGDGGRQSQPFTLVVPASVVLAADVHAHLTYQEVIGFLGGHWDARSSTLVVSHIFPGRSLCVDDDSARTSCEMDPVAEVTVRDRIASLGLSVVGWYHSHPRFSPTPSVCDVDNQCNYQAFFRDADHDVDPFVGLIVSPYDEKRPSPISRMRWFQIDSPQTNPKAMTMQFALVEDLAPADLASAPDALERLGLKDKALTDVVTTVQELVDDCVDATECVEAGALWSTARGQNHLDKLTASLRDRCVGWVQRDRWLLAVDEIVKHVSARLPKG